MRAVHWFRNDLRIRDNPALCDAARAEDGLAGLFVLDERLLAPRDAPRNRDRYLAACLSALGAELADREVPFVVANGRPHDVIPDLCRRHRIGRVTWNADYSPVADARDAAVTGALERNGVEVRVHKSRVVFEAHEVTTRAGGAYSVYTPYARRWRERLDAGELETLRAPRMRGLADLEADTTALEARMGPGAEDRAALPAADEAAARRRLDRFVERRMARYGEDRDRPDLDGTSRLSPMLRFGLLSPRQCVTRAKAAGEDDRRRRAGAEKWIGELVWRDFYAGILAMNPAAARMALQPAFRDIEWNDDPDAFEAWRDGRTGYPIVDAGMRQLAETGWMHNRVRMIVASFLVKDLLIDWRLGERHFFDVLFDGDPASNNGGWQWAASTGTDAAPYFRIFNPTAQGERFDPAGDYVRRWVPELAGLAGKAAHHPWEAPLAAAGYPAPIVDHAERRKLALDRYQAARDASQTPLRG